MTNITGISAIAGNGNYAAEVVKAMASVKPDEIEGATAKADFAEVLGNAVESIASRQREAETKVAEFASGRTDDLAGMVVAVNKAGLAMQLGLEVRNRVMDAYHEVMRMQV